MSAMRRADVARLVALAVIWGASYVFIRVLAPPLGAVWTATLRVLVGGLALVAWLAAIGVDAEVRRHWRAYLAVGILNCAIPFTLIAWAALTLPASYLVILNAVSPMFSALAAALWLDERLTVAKLAGLAVGTAGVALLSRAGPLAPTFDVVVAIAASLGAALCYALAGVWLKRHGSGLKPTAVAGWGQLAAAFVLLPVAAGTPVPGPVTPLVLANLAALALVCSAVAFLLYYRLIRDIGPTRAMTVTFLMPAFGMLWGVLLLDEIVTASMLLGALLVVGGTVAVLRPVPMPSRREAA